MKSVSVALKSHLALEVTTLATCWKVTLKIPRPSDGKQVFGFTDHAADLVVDSVTYVASTGYTASAIQTSGALNVDNLEVDGGLDSEAITETDILAGLWDFADIEIFQVNYADLTQGTMKLRKGNLGEVRTGRGTFVAELRGMMQKLQQATGYLVLPGCNADLGDARCGVNLSLFTNTTSVTSVVSNSFFVASALASQPNGWYNGGKLTWLTGNNAGLSMEVKSFSTASAEFVLTIPMPFEVQAGASFSVYAGCDKSLATCVSKFNNVVNFRGFPHLPGINALASGKG